MTFIDDITFSDMPLKSLDYQKTYLDNDQLIEYCQYRDQNNKKVYLKKYYNLDDSIKKTTNTIEILGGAKDNKRPELIGSLKREDQEIALKKIFGDKFRPIQVIGLSYFNIPSDLIENYMWTYKIDGFNSYIKVDGHVLQAEYYKDVYYVFDILDISGPLPKRLEFIKKNIKPGKYMKFKTFYKIDTEKPVIETLQNLMKEKMSGVDTDGIIFSNCTQNYEDTVHLKLKPKKFLTNDYKYIYVPDKKLYYLQCRGSKFNYLDSLAQGFKLAADGRSSLFNFHIPYLIDNNYSYICNVSKSLRHTPKDLQQKLKQGALDGKIVETAYTDEMIPYPIRVREDKEYPNGFNTCLTNYENRLNPIEDIKHEYFQINNKSEKYEDFRKVGNQFRKDALDSAGINKGDVVFDFGSGRGVNLHIILPLAKKYYSLEPDHIVWVEQYKRMRDIIKQKHIRLPQTVIFDYSSLYNILKKINKIDLFISNYSIHYQLGNIQDIHTLEDIFDKCERFVFLYYDGKQIFNLLKKKNPYQNDKYFIKRLYTDMQFKEYGQRIEILLPTISEDIYTEYLVNVDTLEKATNGKIVYNKPALQHSSKLSSEDKEYLSLIQITVIEK